MPVIGFTGEDFDNAGVYPLITFGKLVGVDTTSTVSTINPNGETWAVNDVLFMNTTDGGLTKFRPSGTNTQIQRIAKVLKVGSTDGQLFIFNTARTAGLPNLTSDYLWVGNGDDKPQEVIRTDVGITTTGFTYNNNNTLTITDDNGGTLSTTINQMSGLTVTSGLTTDTLNISNTPNENNDLIQILGRNSSTGDVEYRDVKTIGNNITVVTGSTYSATTTDDVIGIDSSTNTVTLYLPDSVSSGRLRYDIKDIGVNSRRNPITIKAAGSDTIITTSVVSSFELSADGGAVILVSTGTGQWWQM
jgi:hypothetical protein